MPNLGGWEFVILVVVVLLLFGAKKLPDMARSVGQSARIFKGEMKGMKDDPKKDQDEGAVPPPSALPTSDKVPPAHTDSPTAQPGRTDTPQ
jgi:sec-independent protein translocase protein TatA